MKVTLDVDKLLARGQITPAEYSRLKELAAEETSSLGFNLLVGFGVMATAAGVLALFHSATACILLGIALMVAGVSLSLTRHARKWSLLVTVLLLVGSVTAAGGILSNTHGNAAGFLSVALLCLVGALMARSGMLAAIVALALAGAAGSSTFYGFDNYGVARPAVTILLFGLLSWYAYRWSLRPDNPYGPIALMFARTSLFLVNLGFWIGSLWGDSLWLPREWSGWDLHYGQVLPDWVFTIVWALGLIAVCVWAVRRNRRWVVNLSAVFGAIHFYTQYFVRLGWTSKTLLAGGLLAIVIALAIARYNKDGIATAMPQSPTAATT